MNKAYQNDLPLWILKHMTSFAYISSVINGATQSNYKSFTGTLLWITENNVNYLLS